MDRAKTTAPDETKNIYVLGIGMAYIRDLTVITPWGRYKMAAIFCTPQFQINILGFVLLTEAGRPSLGDDKIVLVRWPEVYYFVVSYKKCHARETRREESLKQIALRSHVINAGVNLQGQKDTLWT